MGLASLQRGRAFEGAEIREAPAQGSKEAVLQRGRAFEGAEIAQFLNCVN